MTKGMRSNSHELESASELLKTYSRTLLQQGEGLISTLSEDERAALADDLAHSGWRSQSVAAQQMMARALSENNRRLGASSSQQLQEGSFWPEQQPSRLSGGVPTEECSYGTSLQDTSALKGGQHLNPGDVWLPTEADDEVAARPWEPPKTRESKHSKQRAIRQVRALAGCPQANAATQACTTLSNECVACVIRSYPSLRPTGRRVALL